MAESKKGCMRRGLEGEEEPIVQVGRGFIVIMEKSIQGIWKRPVLICECEQHSGVGSVYLQYPSDILERKQYWENLFKEIRGSSKKWSLKKTRDLSLVISRNRTSFSAHVCHTSLFLWNWYSYSVPHACETTLFATHLFLPS